MVRPWELFRILVMTVYLSMPSASLWTLKEQHRIKEGGRIVCSMFRIGETRKRLFFFRRNLIGEESFAEYHSSKHWPMRIKNILSLKIDLKSLSKRIKTGKVQQSVMSIMKKSRWDKGQSVWKKCKGY